MPPLMQHGLAPIIGNMRGKCLSGEHQVHAVAHQIGGGTSGLPGSNLQELKERFSHRGFAFLGEFADMQVGEVGIATHIGFFFAHCCLRAEWLMNLLGSLALRFCAGKHLSHRAFCSSNDSPIHVGPEKFATNSGELFQLRTVFSGDSVQPPLIDDLMAAKAKISSKLANAAGLVDSLLQRLFRGNLLFHAPIMR